MRTNFEDEATAALATLTGGGSYLFIGDWSEARWQWLKAQWPWLLCADAQSQRPCNRCAVCRAPALIRAAAIFETEERPLSIETIRALKAGLTLRPLVGERRLVALTHFESATPAAQNALLKILEEPPAATLFLLLARQRAGILATIISRVAVFELGAARFTGPVAALALEALRPLTLAERFRRLTDWLDKATPAAAEELLADWALGVRSQPTLAPMRRLKLLKRLRQLTAQLRRDQTTGLKLALESLIAQIP